MPRLGFSPLLLGFIAFSFAPSASAWNLTYDCIAQGAAGTAQIQGTIPLKLCMTLHGEVLDADPLCHGSRIVIEPKNPPDGSNFYVSARFRRTNSNNVGVCALEVKAIAPHASPSPALMTVARFTSDDGPYIPGALGPCLTSRIDLDRRIFLHGHAETLNRYPEAPTLTSGVQCALKVDSRPPVPPPTPAPISEPD